MLETWVNIVLVFIGFITIIYWYLTRNYDYWSKQGIKGPRPILLFGNFLDRLKKNMAEIDTQYIKKFGNVYGIFDGTSPALQIADPELIKIVTVKDFHVFNNRRELRTEHPVLNTNIFHSRDKSWKRTRTIASHAFTSGKIKQLYGSVRNCVQDYLDHLEQLAQSGQNLSLKEYNGQFTMDSIACCAFAAKTNSLKEPDNPFLVNCRKICDFKAIYAVPAFIFPKYVNKLLGITSALNPVSSDWIIELSKQLIEKRRKSGEKYKDFIQLLMDAQLDDKKEGEDDLGSHFITEDQEMTVKDKFANHKLTEEEILGQAWVFLIAGYETTAVAMSFMAYELAVNPDCQQRLFEEIDSAMGSQKEISYEQLHSLPYLDACVSETLRKYPSVTRLERECNQDYLLDV